MAGRNAFLSNLNKTELWTFKLEDKFVKEILELWIEINFQKQLRSTNEYEEQYLWNNSLISIDIKLPVFFQKWYRRGVIKISHLFKKLQRKLLSHIEFHRKFDLETPFLQYAGLISSLSDLRHKIIPEYECRKLTIRY